MYKLENEATTALEEILNKAAFFMVTSPRQQETYNRDYPIGYFILRAPDNIREKLKKLTSNDTMKLNSPYFIGRSQYTTNPTVWTHRTSNDND